MAFMAPPSRERGFGCTAATDMTKDIIGTSSFEGPGSAGSAHVRVDIWIEIRCRQGYRGWTGWRVPLTESTKVSCHMSCAMCDVPCAMRHASRAMYDASCVLRYSRRSERGQIGSDHGPRPSCFLHLSTQRRRHDMVSHSAIHRGPLSGNTF